MDLVCLGEIAGQITRGVGNDGYGHGGAAYSDRSPTGDSLTEIDRQRVEARLQERLAEIQRRRASLRGFGADQRDAELADYDQHPADEGTETHEQELDETTDMLLADEEDTVKLALTRLAEGKYGICIDCGKEIEPARLEAVPEAVRCIDDQQRYEALNRARWPPPPRDLTP
jgi:DnaK suppressor protein